MKTLIKIGAKKFILISLLFIFSLNIFANGNGVVVTTYAGTGFAGSQDGDALTEAKFNLPVGIGGFGTGICFDNEGNLLVADAGNNKIRKISPTGVVTTIAGSGIIGYLDGPANVARFDFLADIAVDSIGNIYIADGNNHRIRKLDTAGIVSTLAGSGTCGHVDGIGTAASFCTPTGVEIDKEGNILVADLNNSAIRKVTPAGVVTTVKVVSAGAPIQVALDKEGNIFFTVFSNRIFKIDTNGIETLIAGGSPGFADDTGAAAMFNLPWGIALDNDGNIYVGDQKNHRVRKIDTNNVVTTLAGTGIVGFKDGSADSAQFNRPSGLCHDVSGSIFVADQGNNRIRKIAVPIQEEVIISGTVYVDFDSSCSLTAGDSGIAGRMVKFEHSTGQYYVFSGTGGKYNFSGPVGNYTVKLINTKDVKETCDRKVYSFSLTLGEKVQNANFFIEEECATASGFRSKLSFPFITPCPGAPIQYCFTFFNFGLVPIKTSHCTDNVSYIFKYDKNIFLNPQVESNCKVVTSSITSFNKQFDQITVFLDDTLYLFEKCEICISGIINPNAQLGEKLSFFYEFQECCLFSTTGGAGGSIQAGGFTIISCSQDPNDKLLVTPQGCGTLGKIEKNEPLTYKVRFQNMGNAPANKIVIKDTLDNDLDITSLLSLESSHTITKIEARPPNVLIWTFENINLPDSASDPEGSIGFIEYQINHLPDVPDNTIITNHAAIFFDFNEPIITNTTLNTIVDEPFPVASFNAQRQCAANAYDFTYTGGTENVTFLWDFGSDANPSSSAEQNPAGVTFSSPGKKEIQLTVDDSTGCNSTIIDTINVEDITCGKNKDKVLVCHAPKGNPANSQLLCINAKSVDDHVAHGDCLGECDFVSAKSSPIKNISELNQVNEDYCTIYPNPFNNKMQIIFVSTENTFLEITITDLFGKLVATISNKSIKSNEVNTFEFGDNKSLHSGIFFCKVRTDNMQKVYKIIKLGDE